MSFGPLGFGDSRIGSLSPDSFAGFGGGYGGYGGMGALVDRRIMGGSAANFGLGAQVDQRLARSFSNDPIGMFEQQAYRQYAEELAKQQAAMPGPGGSTGGMGNPTGGVWDAVNRWNPQIQKASAATGVPANVIKAIMSIESEGNPNALSPQGYYGLMQTGPESDVPAYMMDRSWLAADPYNQILAGATELANKYNVMGRTSWDDAARAYIGLSGADAYGTDQWAYLQRFQNAMQQLNASSAGSYSTGANEYASAGLFGGPGTQLGGSLVGNSVVQIAEFFVGRAPYVWGGVPGPNQSPILTGWDCSGMTWYLDQKYGTGNLPQGSHYQYQYAQRTGQLFTNLSQLQPGDLIFIDTGWMNGSGAELNRAGHVAMYAGNGKIVHAANESEGTIISDLSRYPNILGAMHMSWSGGAGAGYAAPGQQYQQQTYAGNWFDQPLSVLLGGR